MTGRGAGYVESVAVTDEPPEYIVERLRRALAEDPSVHELGVQVAVAGGRVFLTGHVGTPERRDAISALAHQVLPEHEVHNQTTVGGFPEADDHEDVR